MKIGFVISFFDFRNDLRKVIEVISLQHQVVIFTPQAFAATIKSVLPKGTELRIISERKPSFRNRLLESGFLLFKKLPASRNNYFLMEQFKISNLRTGLLRKAKAKLILNFQRLTPRIYSYDNYLSKLDYTAGTKIDDIDQFVFTTEILDDYLFARLLKSNHPLCVYVYSWDHPCKHTRFSRKIKYKVWNDSIRTDLIELQGIKAEHITIAGASQLGFLYNYSGQLSVSDQSENYIYFGCAIGVEDLVPSEIRIIKQLAHVLKETKPKWKLVVRPYPALNNWAPYNQLKSIENIRLDNQYRSENMSVSDTDIFEKYKTISSARAFFHLGTTLGLEACFTNTPVFIIDFKSKTKRSISIDHFVHQYQNEKYFLTPFKENIIPDVETCRQVLLSLDKKDYLRPNKQIPSLFPTVSFELFAHKLLS